MQFWDKDGIRAMHLTIILVVDNYRDFTFVECTRECTKIVHLFQFVTSCGYQTLWVHVVRTKHILCGSLDKENQVRHSITYVCTHNSTMQHVVALASEFKVHHT